MKSFQDNVFTGFVILILVSLVSSCPEDCICQLDNSRKSANHLKCSSQTGLSRGEWDFPIHSLDLSHADLHLVSSYVAQLQDLVTLDLSHNNISWISRLGGSIKTLKLNHNKLTSEGLTRFPHSMENLDLSFNDITGLPLELTKLRDLKQIALLGNKINCNCQTLEVRDWMVKKNVLIDNVTCFYPVEVRGELLLQVQKSEICGKEDSDHEQNENGSDLALADQAIVNEGSGDADDDELGGTFMLLSKNDSKKLERLVANDRAEGSGDDEIVDQVHTHEQLSVQSESDDEIEEDEGSGSGGGPIPMVSFNTFDDSLVHSTHSFDDGFDDSEQHGLGIMQVHNISTTTEIVPDDVSDELVVPVFRTHDTSAFQSMSTHKPEEQEQEQETNEDDDVTEANVEGAIQGEKADFEEEEPSDTDDAVDAQNASITDGGAGETGVQEAGAGDSKSTYILLAVVLIILLALIIFVAVKRTKASRRSRSLEDPESPRATELQDMDKKNLGKPVHKNGNAEHAPLIDDRKKVDISKPVNGNKKVPYVPHEDKDGHAQEPLLKNKEEPDSNNYRKIPESESNNNVAPSKQIQPHTETPVGNQEVPKPAARQSLEKPAPEPRKGGYPPPKSPRTKKPSTGDDDVFHPSSPKATSRYSPVYSPETGRVKIKLTETPKPKTPLLVTRSRSNAGDIVTTPTENQKIPDNQ